MMPSLFSAVSGLKSQQTSLDVIANNIANADTTGYKSQRVTFADLLSQTLSGATAPTATQGGTNPSQIGLGVQVAGTQNIMTPGSTQSTGVSTDVALGGDGFFVVEGGSEGKYQYTRAGSFDVDEDGNLTVNGYKVCGWLQTSGVDANGNNIYVTDTDPEPINLYSDSYSSNKKVIAPKATTEATVSGLLYPGETASGSSLTNIGTVSDYDTTSTVEAYDAQGNKYDVTLNWKKCYTEDGITTWYYSASTTSGATLGNASGYIAFDSSGKPVDTATISESGVTGVSGTNTNGYTTSSLTGVTNLAAGNWTLTTSGTSATLSDGTNSYTGTVASDGSISFTVDGNTVNVAAPASGTLADDSVTFTLTETDTSYTFNDTPTLTLTPNNSGATQNIKLDFTGINSYASSATDSDLSTDADGYAAGTLQSVSISSDGTIVGTYDNDQKQSLGVISLAMFDNDEGLEKTGNNLYVESANSGNADYVVAGTGGSSTMSSGVLEMSNVDLAQEFSNMMISQRAYQANSKVISTSDDMLQALINMIR